MPLLQRIKNQVAIRLRGHQKRKLIAQGGATSDVYDAAYGGSVDEYTVHYSQSRYLPVWEAIVARIKPGSGVLEVGCGPAQFAQMMFDREIPGSYVGFDFSANAIELAKQNLPGNRVEVDDARTTDLFATVEYDTIVCTEVLEHIVDDLLVLERIPAGKQVLATVPDFDYESHVRWFSDVVEVRERYGHLFSTLDITIHHHTGDEAGERGTFFLIHGVRG